MISHHTHMALHEKLTNAHSFGHNIAECGNSDCQECNTNLVTADVGVVTHIVSYLLV